MKRPLIKLYIIVIAALAATVVWLPSVVGRTSEWAVAAATQAELALYNSVPHDTAPAPDGARIVIILDDGWETQYTKGYALLSEYGMKACIAVVPSMVDTSGYMTYGQLAAVYKDGWDLLNHTYDHIPLTQLSKAEQRRQLVDTRTWLETHGFLRGADIAVYPTGAYNDITVSILEQNGFTAARSLKSVWDSRKGCTREDIEICNIISDMPMCEIKAAVDKAVSNCSALILILHKIEPVTDDTCMQIDAQMFLDVVRYIDAQGDKLSVVTVTQLMAAE